MTRILATLAIAISLVGGFSVQPRHVAAGQSFTFECADPSGAPTTGCDVNLDPNFHADDLGTLLFHATNAGKRTIALPDLAGQHKIVVRASARTVTGTNTAVIVQNTVPACPTGWAAMGYQSWWEGAPGGLAMRHVHGDACLPVNNLIVNGTQTFTWAVLFHAEVGARFTRARLADVAPSGSSSYPWVRTTGLSQPNSAGDLSQTLSVTLNLSSMAAGRHEFRWGFYAVQPDGKVQLLSTRHEICVRTCSPARRSGTYQGSGSWYGNDTIGYVDARVHTPLPVSP